MMFGRAEKEPTAPAPVASAPEGLELQRKSATPSKTTQTILPDSEYYGLASVTVEKIPDLYQDVSAVTAIAPHVLAGDVFIDAIGAEVAGTMPDNGAVNVQLQPGNSYVIPEGYHSGAGRVNAAAGGSTGTELNYEIVGGISAPPNPKENTIWINTPNEITTYVFSTSKPESPFDGMVWIHTGINSAVAFNALKTNTLLVYPNLCQQFNSGTWASRQAAIYQAGVWRDWTYYLFNITTATDTSDFEFTPHTNSALNPVLTYHEGQYVSIRNPSNSATTVYLKKDPDFTGFSKLVLRGRCNVKGEKMVIAEAGQRETFGASYLASVTLDVTESEYVIDISEYPGKHAVGFNFRAASGRYIYISAVFLE